MATKQNYEKEASEMADEDVSYTCRKLDDEVVNRHQIRLILRTSKEHLPEMVPDRQLLRKMKGWLHNIKRGRIFMSQTASLL
ncbi:MAG: hypothetical protein ACR2KZ_14150 [Segetibacter sp.]